MVGADIANLANEAALLAARRGHEKVAEADFTDSLEKIVLGAPRGIVLSDEEKRRTAYHESGHAIVGMLTPGADPVRKVSIIPRTMSLGVTISAPDVERTNYDEEYLITRIKVALGGRVAEELVYDSISAGAESDIQQLTGIARQMVGRWGMSQAIGPIAVIPCEAQGPLLPGVSEVSEATQQLIDERGRAGSSTRRYAGRHAAADRAPRQARLLTEALLDAETLDEDDAYAAARVPREREPADDRHNLAYRPRERSFELMATWAHTGAHVHPHRCRPLTAARSAATAPRTRAAALQAAPRVSRRRARAARRSRPRSSRSRASGSSVPSSVR